MRPTYHLTRTNIMYISQWMTVWEDWVSKEGGVAIGMFNRIEVHNAVIVVPILEDGGRELSTRSGFKSSRVAWWIY